DKMKVLLKTLPKKYALRVDEVFLSLENQDTLKILLPKLLQLLAPTYTPIQKEV
ncbi:19587_t:CDS:1, partial [Racocetra fulgida]